MQSLINWNPWQELDQIQKEMNRLFGRRRGFEAARYPAVNLWADDKSLVLTAEIPGLDPEQIDLNVNRDSITLSVNRQPETPQEGQTYYRRERPSASFSRTLELPIEVDPTSADAEYVKGVLTVRLARPTAHQPKKVTVKSA